MSERVHTKTESGRPGWGWRRRGSPLSRWLAVVGGPLFALSFVALYAAYPDPEFITKLVVVLFLPATMIALVLFEESGTAMRRDWTGHPRRARRGTRLGR